MPTQSMSAAFVARSGELAALSAAYQQAIVDGPAVALVAGEPGIGKTRLVGEFVTRLGSQPRVVTGQCLALGADGLPYAPFREILRRLIMELGAEALRAHIPGGSHSVLAGWIPDGDRQPGRPAGRGQLFEEMLGLCEALAADRPLVIVLEDLHWADPSSSALLEFLTRNLTRHGMLIICTYRPTDVDASHPVRTLVSEIGRGRRCHRVEPERLCLEHVARQMAAILDREPEPAHVIGVHRRSQGVPLFVEALSAADESTLNSLRDYLLEPVVALSEPARQVLRTASVCGIELPHALLAAVHTTDAADLDAALRELTAGYLLLVTDDRYAFRHALIHEAVYNGLLPGERQRLHRTCAQALATRPELLPADRLPTELAAHWHAAGDHGRALAAAWHAAEAARRTFAYAEQLRMLQRVLDLWHRVPDAPDRVATDRATVAELAAEAALAAGAGAEAARMADIGLDDRGGTPPDEQRARLLSLRGQARHSAGADGMTDLLEALAALPAEGHGELRGTLLSWLAVMHLNVNDFRRAQSLAEQALAIGGTADDSAFGARALGVLGTARTHCGAPDDANTLLTRAKAVAERSGDDYVLLAVLLYQTRLFADTGEFERTIAVSRHGVALARRVGLERSRGTLLASNLAWGLVSAGRWSEADDAIDAALDLEPPGLFAFALVMFRCQLAINRGDLDHARRLIDELAAMPMTGPGMAALQLPAAELTCQLAWFDGDIEHADRLLGDALTTVDKGCDELAVWELLCTGARIQRVRLADCAGDGAVIDAANERCRQLRAVAERTAAPTRLATAFRVAFHATITGDDATAWEAAITNWRELGHRLFLAQSLTGAAAAAMAAGDRQAATARLREATGIADDLGAGPLRAEINRLAFRAGIALKQLASAESSADARRERLGLTAREMDVLRLLAAGMSNRQIAAELFISPSTAGVHVSRILAKLDVASRGQAAAKARRLGLVDAPDPD